MGSGPSPKKHERPRRCRWMMTIAALVVTIAWVGSAWVRISATPGASHTFDLEAGRLHYRYTPGRFIPERWGFARAHAPFDLTPDYHVYPASWFMRLPLWIPVVLFAAPAAWRWWRDLRRRRTPGMCRRCGYALEGLTGPTVTCPECGHRQRPSGAAR